MCGLAGLIALDGTAAPPEAEATVRAMLARLTHRGPDGEGVERVGPVVLGHRRLAIIDLTGGAQPLTDAAGRVTLVFNGEIYNYAALRDELAGRGHVFRTRSDSEVLAAALAEWGADALPRLRGMFAFAAWDAPRRRLWLVRDRLGKKPLYWARRGGLVGFASELPALMAWPAVGRALDPAALAGYLRYGYIAAPRTALADVHKLPAATAVEIAVAVEVEVQARRYWDVAFAPERQDRDAARADVLRLVDEAVADRLIADVPVGAFLSGGVDSALVVTRAARRGPLKTFTVGFDGSPELDERAAARAVAALAGTEHTEAALRLDAPTILDDVVRHLGEPHGDPSALPTYLVAQLARGAVKVVLTGDGGDETFAGYNRYARSRWSLAYARLPPLLRRLVAGTLRALGVSAARLGEIEARAARPGAAYAELMTVIDRAQSAALVHADHRAAAERALDEELLASLYARAGGDWLDRLQYTDLCSYLAEGVLVKVDRMTMAHGIEARSPLLDHRLVELAARLPSAWRRPPGGGGKLILREVAGQVLPRAWLDRPKRGFDVPVRRWMAAGSPLRAAADAALGESQLVRDGWLDGAALAARAPDDDGAASLGNRWWSLYVLELWYRRWR